MSYSTVKAAYNFTENFMKPEWGKKVVCTECSNIFYDMRKTHIVCTKCGANVKNETNKKSGKSANKKSRRSAILDTEDMELRDDYNISEDRENLANGNFVMEGE